MPVQLRDHGFDPGHELVLHEQSLNQKGKFGATASFVGSMRDVDDGQPVHAMTLEHYPGMTEQHLQRISAQARERWEILDTLIIHRTGFVRPGDPIVLVAVWSAHRAAAFDACRFLIEELKTRAPFWKKEQLNESSRWVEHNTPAR